MKSEGKIFFPVQQAELEHRTRLYGPIAAGIVLCIALRQRLKAKLQ